jgi:hypothetical protein
MRSEQDHDNSDVVTIVPTLRVSWSQDRCWHGDTVKIRVRAWFVPDGTRVDLSINPTGAAAIATIPNLQINAGVLDHDYLVDWSTLVIAAGSKDFEVTAVLPTMLNVAAPAAKAIQVDLPPPLFSA